MTQWFDVDVTKGKEKHVVRLLAPSRAAATSIVRSWGKGRKVTGVRQTPTHIARRFARMNPLPTGHIASVNGKALKFPWEWEWPRG